MSQIRCDTPEIFVAQGSCAYTNNELPPHPFTMAWLGATVLMVVYYETSLDYWHKPTVIGLSAWEFQIAHISNQITHTVSIQIS